MYKYISILLVLVSCASHKEESKQEIVTDTSQKGVDTVAKIVDTVKAIVVPDVVVKEDVKKGTIPPKKEIENPKPIPVRPPAPPLKNPDTTVKKGAVPPKKEIENPKPIPVRPPAPPLKNPDTSPKVK